MYFILNILTLTNISEIAIVLTGETRVGLKIKRHLFLANCREHLSVATNFIGYFHIVNLKIPAVVLKYVSIARPGAF